jgi:hypothetical protein
MAALPGTAVGALNSRTESMGEYGVKSVVRAIDHPIADFDDGPFNRRGLPETIDDTAIAGAGTSA